MKNKVKVRKDKIKSIKALAVFIRDYLKYLDKIDNLY